MLLNQLTYYTIDTMRFITYVILVFPFVATVWLYDILVTGVKLACLSYYNFTIHRSEYLRERIIINAWESNGISTNNQTDIGDKN